MIFSQNLCQLILFADIAAQHFQSGNTEIGRKVRLSIKTKGEVFDLFPEKFCRRIRYFEFICQPQGDDSPSDKKSEFLRTKLISADFKTLMQVTFSAIFVFH
jgi:hypothetical protein